MCRNVDRRRPYVQGSRQLPASRQEEATAKSLYAGLGLKDNDLSLPVRWDALWDLIVG